MSEEKGETVIGQLWAYDEALGVVVLQCDASAGGVGGATSGTGTNMGAACINPTVLAAASNAALAGSSPNTNPSTTSTSTISDPSIISAGKNTRSIKSVSLVQTSIGAAASGASQLSGLNSVNLAQVENRERVAALDSNKRYNRIGKGVGREGQMVFDALDKTLPCRWHQTHIIVMDDIVISAPYVPSSVSVPGIPTDLLSLLAEGETPSAKQQTQLPQGAAGKARSWKQVCKVLEGERKKISVRLAAEGKA
ncbi:Uncharacterized conserved protein [Ceraceosorus bombacis]|uniref:Uncharacterized conserved protein n=1 Tax=Ceraceosorus bombacis TaxID=401625 RepID=A0A0N7LA05_9BASI|nr:Uncharacterized conserved protein [Ceraceosorus bombacis]